MDDLKEQIVKLAGDMEALAEQLEASEKEDAARNEKTASHNLRDFSLGSVGSLPGRTGNPLLDFLTS